jgi:hypothetical protein
MKTASLSLRLEPSVEPRFEPRCRIVAPAAALPIVAAPLDLAIIRKDQRRRVRHSVPSGDLRSKKAANWACLCGAAIRSCLDIPQSRRGAAALRNGRANGVAQRDASEKNDKCRQWRHEWKPRQ